MGKIKIKDLRALGYDQGPAIGLALHAMNRDAKALTKADKLALLGQVLASPEDFIEHELLNRVAEKLIHAEVAVVKPKLRREPGLYSVYGAENIEQGAKLQMATAMKLPVTVAGALMPDAHAGYGLPIGGVLATENAVIPYGVGVDIGCRMALSVFDMDPSRLRGQLDRFKNLLGEHSCFGPKEVFEDPGEHAVMDRPEFQEVETVKALKDKAWKQLGTSGGGNHFVEFGEVTLPQDDEPTGLKAGTYVGLLTHSGSRGLGAILAKHYTRIVMQHTVLPKEARSLAWLDLDSEAGQEYWLAMNLAGDYAAACHEVIHRRIAKALGRKPLAKVENHHNFAWKEVQDDGREWVVHRKGATPAGKGVMGIIPGSMTAPGYIVRGKGIADSLASASHGAGRVLSRSGAKNSLVSSKVRKYLRDHGVELIGGGLDEAPMAYKDIELVMAAQTGLVDVVGSFQPRIVRMDESKEKGNRL
ncbi:MAG TPA: RNA-splicing ligase RtcB [Cytophagales bacterium]|nr:RNA-splicing ligase RtcB [Cytophagales bacterium]